MHLHLHLLRHGPTAIQGRFQGRTDLPLTDGGGRAMTRTAECLGRIDGIVTSPLRRCAEFARPFAANRSIPLHVEEGLRELDFGRWDGRPLDEIREEDGAALAAFHADPRRRPPEGEAPLAFVRRVCATIETIVDDAIRRGTDGEDRSRHLLLVTHGGVIKTVIARVLHMPLEDCSHIARLEVKPATLSHLSLFVDDGGKRLWQLHGLNLGGEERTPS